MPGITNTSIATEGKGETFDFEEASADFLGVAPGLEEAGFEVELEPEPQQPPNSGVPNSYLPEDDPTNFIDATEQDTQPVEEEEGEVEDGDIKALTDNLRAQMKELGIEEPEEAPAPAPDEEFDKRIESIQNFAEFEQSFEAVMGIKPKEAFTQYRDMVTATQAMAAEMQNVYGEVTRLRQEITLRSAWGQDYEKNLATVKKHFSKLAPPMQQALDNDQGALLIWNSLNGNTRTAPGVVQGRRATSTGQPQLKYSQILAMSDKEYNSTRVQQALATGNYIHDVKL